MNLEEAKLVIKDNQYRIGTKDEAGFSVDAILAVPKKESLRNVFFKNYLESRDLDLATIPLGNEEFEVWTIDLKHVYENGVLFYNKIAE